MKRLIIPVLTILLLALALPAQAQDKAPKSKKDFTPGSNWVEKRWEGVRFSIPDNWKQEEAQPIWGLIDEDTFQGVTFGVFREQDTIDKLKREDGVEMTKFGQTTISGQPVTLYQMAAQGPLLGQEITIKSLVISLDQPLPNGQYLYVIGAVMGLDWDRHKDTIKKIFGSLNIDIEFYK